MCQHYAIHDYLHVITLSLWLGMLHYACYWSALTGFLTNYFSAHIDGKLLKFRVLKLIPSVLICEKRYQNTSFSKGHLKLTFLTWAFKQKLFLFFVSFFSFSSFHLYFPFSLSFFFFFSFCFSWWIRWAHLKNLRLKVPHKNWKSILRFDPLDWFFYLSFFFFWISLSFKHKITCIIIINS